MARRFRLRSRALAPDHDGERAQAQAGRPSSQSWWVLAALLALGSLLAAGLEPQHFDWQPAMAMSQPWRWWTAAWVHWSDAHRWANVAGALLVGALGWRAGCDRLDGLAWFVAWPLTQLGLLMQPSLAHYGGLSGVLHAGVVVVAISLWQRERGPRRWLGAAMLAGVVLKVLLERPWHAVLQTVPGWDIAIAPGAHLSGAVMGASCALAAVGMRRRDGAPDEAENVIA